MNNKLKPGSVIVIENQSHQIRYPVPDGKYTIFKIKKCDVDKCFSRKRFMRCFGNVFSLVEKKDYMFYCFGEESCIKHIETAELTRELDELIYNLGLYTQKGTTIIGLKHIKE